MVESNFQLKKIDYLSLALLFILSFFLFADQNLMGPNLTLIAEDFNIVEDIRRTQSRKAVNTYIKQNKGIKKAGDYTMKYTPPLPRLKPSENKKALKIIEKSQEKKLTPEEEKFLKDVEEQDSKSFMDLLKELEKSEEVFDGWRNKAMDEYKKGNVSFDELLNDLDGLDVMQDLFNIRKRAEKHIEGFNAWSSNNSTGLGASGDL